MHKIPQEVVKYFYNHIREPLVDKPYLDRATFFYLSVENTFSLIAPFHILELDMVVAQCNGNKSFGLHGFNFFVFDKITITSEGRFRGYV